MRNLLFSAALFLLLTFVASPSVNAIVQGHSPSPLIVQGHSPIVLLLTDPNGFQIGCTNVPCTSTGSTNFVDTIPASEGPAIYDFTTNTITITSPVTGTWTVEFIGTGTGTFTITVTTFPNGGDTSVTLTIVSGSTSNGQVGSTTFTINADGTITPFSTGVPEFPWGMGLMVSALIVGLALLRSRHQIHPK
jgi:hypothetical protein